jgi:MFS transporter, DHA3 family, macrolide efflux protein
MELEAKSQSAGSMKTFGVIWLGQLMSLIGSGLTSFALAIWIYKQSGSTTQLTVISLFTTIPGLVAGPFIGALVDRWDRRAVMIASLSVSGFSIMGLALLFFTNQMAFWHICLGVGINSIAGAFLWPAYHASTAVLVPPHQLGRAAGMNELSYAATQLLAPVLGGVLLGTIRLHGIFLIDGLSFLFALATLLVVRIPKVAATTDGAKGKGSLWREALSGWTYIRARSGLLALLVFAVFTRFVMGSVHVLITPLVLSFTNEKMLGVIMSVGGVGAVIGSVAMASWGGPRRRVYGLLAAELVGGVCVMLAGLQPSVMLFGAAIFVYLLRWPVGLVCNQAIWLSKVAPDIQGRVLSIRQLVGFSALPLSYAVAGPLVDRVLEPMFAPGGALASAVGGVVGVGVGRGIAFLFVILGALTIVTSVAGFLHPRLRLVELELPDARPRLDARPSAQAQPVSAAPKALEGELTVETPAL